MNKPCSRKNINIFALFLIWMRNKEDGINRLFGCETGVYKPERYLHTNESKTWFVNKTMYLVFRDFLQIFLITQYKDFWTFEIIYNISALETCEESMNFVAEVFLWISTLMWNVRDILKILCISDKDTALKVFYQSSLFM